MGRIIGLSDLGLLLIGGIAAAVLVFMVWPRRIALRPRCRGCGYSVDGYRPARCPECGADLNVDGAIRVGPRFGFMPRMLVMVVAAAVSLAMVGELVQRRIIAWRANATVVEYYRFNWQERYDFDHLTSGDPHVADGLTFAIRYPVSAEFVEPSDRARVDGPATPWHVRLEIRELSGEDVGPLAELLVPPDSVTAADVVALFEDAGINEALARVDEHYGIDEFTRDGIVARILHNINVAEQQDPFGKLKTLAASKGAAAGGDLGVSHGNSYGHQAVTSVPEPKWWHRFFEKTWRVVFTAVVCSILGVWVARSHTRRLRAAGLADGESD